MCFSAKASFIAAGTLSVIGLLSVKKAYSGNQKFLPFATTPLIFALQQTAEGCVWLALTSAEAPTVSAYLFIFYTV